MKRKYLIGLGLAAGAAGVMAANREQIGTAVARVTGKTETPHAKQWDFDGQELRTLMDRVTDERGELRPHVNVFVDGENVRFLDGLGTALGEGSTIVIVPAVSGG